MHVKLRDDRVISIRKNQLFSTNFNMNPSILSPSANWYLSSALTVSPVTGMLAYAAKNTTVVMIGTQVRQHLRGHKRGAKINAVSFSQHTSTEFLLASGGSDRKICIWNAETGLLVEEHVCHSKDVTALSSSSLIPGLFISGDKSGRIVITNVSACLGLESLQDTTAATNASAVDNAT